MVFFLFCPCMNLDYSSVIILKEYTLGGGKSTVKSSETQLHCSEKAYNAGNSENQQMFPREQREREIV